MGGLGDAGSLVADEIADQPTAWRRAESLARREPLFCELIETLDASAATVRRDLELLEKQKLLAGAAAGG
jgi:hypothetical protein